MDKLGKRRLQQFLYHIIALSATSLSFPAPITVGHIFDLASVNSEDAAAFAAVNLMDDEVSSHFNNWDFPVPKCLECSVLASTATHSRKKFA